MQLYLPVRSTDCAEALVAANAATRPTVKDRILMKITPLLHVAELTPNRRRGPSVCGCARKSQLSKNRHAGLVPGIHVFLLRFGQEVVAGTRLRQGCAGAHELTRPAEALSEGGKPRHDAAIAPYPAASCR